MKGGEELVAAALGVAESIGRYLDGDFSKIVNVEALAARSR